MYATGVDLGTTFTAAATWHRGRASVVRLGEQDAVPSAVLIDDERPVFGDEADRRAAATPELVARAFKRRFGDEVPLLIAGRDVTPEALTTGLLRWVLDRVASTQDLDHVHQQPKRVVLTVPATWQGYRLDLMRQVVAGVGLTDERTVLLPEPAAAAVFYAGREQVLPGSVVGVYDFGGGTFDATLLRKTTGGFEILGVPLGDDRVGGIDVDHLLRRIVLAEAGVDPRSLDQHDSLVLRGIAALNAAVVQAKEALSKQTDVVVAVALPGCSTEVTVNRRRLEREAEPLVLRTAGILRDTIASAGLSITDVDRILLVGGSSRMPLVADVLRDELGIATVTDAHPKYAVCLGAAIAAGSLLKSTPPAAAVEEAPTGLPTTDTVSSIAVDLDRAGLTDAGHVPVRPAAELRRRRPGPQNEPLVGRLGDDETYVWAARRAIVLTVVLLLGVGATLVVLLAVRS